jgi:hypothetical protein
MRSDVLPAWITALVAILALLASSYFAYRTNADETAALSVERSPVLTISCSPTEMSPWDIAVGVYQDPSLDRTFDHYGVQLGPDNPITKTDHLLCTLRNYGRLPATKLTLNYAVSVCNKNENRSTQIPVVGAGDRTGVLFLNGDESSLYFSVSEQTSFVVPPTQDRQQYSFVGYPNTVNWGFPLAAADKANICHKPTK